MDPTESLRACCIGPLISGPKEKRVEETSYIAIKNRGSLYGGLLVHLPELLTCPACGEESNDVVFCLDCGS